MPWVIWDILVPMLATFLIGLATGWLLWRWRRQKVNVATAHLQAAPPQMQETDDSMNVVLIEERDSALVRADAAEAELESLKRQIDVSVMGAASDSSQAQALVAAPDEQAAEKATAEVDALKRELEKEKASKAEIERSLVDLNTRYKDLSVRLEDEISTEAADTLKEAAALESNFDKAKETIAEQGAKLKQLENNEQTLKQKYEQDIAIKDAQLKQERAEREEVRMQLAREKLANEKAAADSAASSMASAPVSVKTDHAAVQNQPNKVRHLTGYSAGSGNKSTISETNTPDEASMVNNSTDSSSSASDGQVQSKPEQSTQDGSVTTQQPPVSAGRSGLSAGQPSTGGHGSAARAEFTPALESEDLGVDEPVRETVVAESIAVEDDAEDQVNVESTADDSASEAPVIAAKAAPPQQQNVTPINAASRKPANTQHSGSTMVETKPKPKSAPKKKKGTSTGYVPSAWAVPEKAPLKAERDDLQEIKGVGPVLEKMLQKTGIYHFRQIAVLDKKGVQELDDQLPQFSGRIQREKWVQQAKTLHRSKYGSAAK